MPCTCLSCMCRFEPNLQTGFPMWKISVLLFCCFVFFISLWKFVNVRWVVPLWDLTNKRETRLFPAQERFGPVRPKGIETLCAWPINVEVLFPSCLFSYAYTYDLHLQSVAKRTMGGTDPRRSPRFVLGIRPGGTIGDLPIWSYALVWIECMFMRRSAPNVWPKRILKRKVIRLPKRN